MRITSNFYILFVLLIFMQGCMQTNIRESTPESKTMYKLILDTSLLEQSNEVFAAWLAYGGTRSVWANEGFYDANPKAKAYKYTFKEELKARETLFNLWNEFKEKEHTLTNEYLDELLKVGLAGYIPEYVWYYYNTPDWEKPSIKLRMNKFIQWKNQYLVNHIPQTLATIQEN